MATIYLDNNATTPLDERVLDAMLPYFRERFGNAASSTHSFGWEAEAAVDLARERLAEAIGASPQEIIWTSGATESDNLALQGAVGPGQHLIVSATEHKAVLDTANALQRRGAELTILPVDHFGLMSPDSLASAVRENTVLATIMLANNETGTINRITELAAVAHERNIAFHTDAAQALGKIRVDVEELDIDLMSLSAHKCYGPKGIGALYVRRRPRRFALRPLVYGGGHERGLRSGTLNVPAIVGFGAATELASESLVSETSRIADLRDTLWHELSSAIPDVAQNGHPVERLPNTLSITFPGTSASDLLGALPGIAASSGSACTSELPEPSHVLRAMGLTPERAESTLRLSLGRFTTAEEISSAAQQIVTAARTLQAREMLV